MVWNKRCFNTIDFSFALEYAIRRIHVNKRGLKLNVTYKLSVNTDDNKLGGSMHTL
jgi:hypothetical protein